MPSLGEPMLHCSNQPLNPSGRSEGGAIEVIVVNAYFNRGRG